jgi:hypothetical protein
VDLLFVSTSGVEQDLLICEDKKETATAAEIISAENKNTTQRLVLLKSWIQKLDPLFAEDLESITGVWHGCRLKLVGSKIVNNYVIHYELASVFVPKDATLMSDAAHFLLTILSLKVLLIIYKLNALLLKANVKTLFRGDFC